MNVEDRLILVLALILLIGYMYLESSPESKREHRVEFILWLVVIIIALLIFAFTMWSK